MTAYTQQGGVWIRVIALVAVAFGLMTIKEGGTVLFGGEAAREAAGRYVPFVLWFNFAAGFAYVLAGVGLWLRERWAAWLAIAIAAATALVFIAFGLYIQSDGAHETRTVIAMTVRTAAWTGIAVMGWHRLLRRAG